MIMKISRFKSVDRYDLFLVLLYNGKCLITFTNYSKKVFIRSAQGHFVPVNSHQTKSAVSKASIGEHLELP